MKRRLDTEFIRAEDLQDVLVARRVDPDTIEEVILISVGHFGGPGNPDGEDEYEFDFDDTLTWCGANIKRVSSSRPYEGDNRDWFTITLVKGNLQAEGRTGAIHVLWDQFVEILRPLNQTIPYSGDGTFPEVED